MGVIYLKAMQGHKLGMQKRYYMSMEGIRKGYLLCPKLYMWYIKGQGFRPRGETSPSLCTDIPPPFKINWDYFLREEGHLYTG